MPGSLTNKPRILRGAFVEYGLSIPPLFVVFQFNPVQLSRNRSLSFAAENDTFECPPCPPPAGESETSSQQQDRLARQLERSRSLRSFHQDPFRGKNLDDDQLTYIRDNQQVTVNEETISFEIRLDATDALNDGDLIASQFGIAPQLATLELMVQPKSESLLGGLVDDLLGLDDEGFSFTKADNPPMILFIWGRKKVLPVNINSLNITETEFSTDLNPLRATASVSLTVIEGPNWAHTYSKVMTEAMSVLNLANIADIANVVIPM